MVDDFTCFDFAGQVFGHTREDSGFVGRAGQYDDCAAELSFNPSIVVRSISMSAPSMMADRTLIPLISNCLASQVAAL